MKKLLSLSFILALFVLFSCNDGTEPVKEGDEKTEETAQDGTATKCGEEGHVCSDACHAKGKKGAKCGEEGHVCSDACHAENKAGTKCGEEGHVCSDACHAENKKGSKCGEEGHVCSDACHA